jgi:molybdopterin/thiamine biosynthesis adenylyltransferase
MNPQYQDLYDERVGEPTIVSHDQSQATGEANLTAVWDYATAFSRNLGLISPEEQERLRNCRVAIPGMGGVGGLHLMTLARMGIGKFRIADADNFDVANFNRQFGATIENIERPKAEVLAAAAQAVNPEADIDAMSQFVTQDNVGSFLDGADLVVDALDFFAFDARRMLFRESARQGLWAVTGGPIGFSAVWMAFDPKGMTFDRYFDLTDQMEPIDMFAAFAMGLTPRSTQVPYFDYSYIDESGRGPSVSAACRLAYDTLAAPTATKSTDPEMQTPLRLHHQCS